jgi:hypothetical protein
MSRGWKMRAYPVKPSNNGDIYFVIDPALTNAAAREAGQVLRARVISI